MALIVPSAYQWCTYIYSSRDALYQYRQGKQTMMDAKWMHSYTIISMKLQLRWIKNNFICHVNICNIVQQHIRRIFKMEKKNQRKKNNISNLSASWTISTVKATVQIFSTGKCCTMVSVFTWTVSNNCRIYVFHLQVYISKNLLRISKC